MRLVRRWPPLQPLLDECPEFDMCYAILDALDANFLVRCNRADANIARLIREIREIRQWSKEDLGLKKGDNAPIGCTAEQTSW